MKKRVIALSLSALLAFGVLAGPSNAASAAALCDESVSTASYCMLDDTDTGSSYYGQAGDVHTCGLTYYGIKINDGYDSIDYIEFNSVGRDGILNPGSSVTATVQMDQECRSWQGAYGATLTLEGLVNKPLVAIQASEEFTYRNKFSGRLDSYCFTEICGFTTWEFNIQIPSDFKPDLFTLKANIVPKSPLFGAISPKMLSYSEVFSLGPRLKNPASASVDHSITETDGRVLCFTSDVSKEGTTDFGITKFEFEIVSYARGSSKTIDQGFWALGMPPDNFATEKLINGDAYSLIVNDAVQHAYYLSEQIRGATYGCKVRAITALGETPWSLEKIVASRTVKGGVVQPLPNVKVPCAKLNKVYPGGVALNSKSKNVGAKTKFKPKISAALYQRNKDLDLDSDGLACER